MLNTKDFVYTDSKDLSINSTDAVKIAPNYQETYMRLVHILSQLLCNKLKLELIPICWRAHYYELDPASKSISNKYHYDTGVSNDTFFVMTFLDSCPQQSDSSTIIASVDSSRKFSEKIIT